MEIFEVIPRPPAAFSPLTTMKSIFSCSFSNGQPGDDGLSTGFTNHIAQKEDPDHFQKIYGIEYPAGGHLEKSIRSPPDDNRIYSSPCHAACGSPPSSALWEPC